MSKLIDFLTKRAFNETIAFLFLIIGIIVGLVVAYVTLKALSIKSAKPKVVKPIADVEQIKERAVILFSSELTRFDGKKLTLLCKAVSLLLEEIPKVYRKNSKFYTALKCKDVPFLDGDIKVCLDFTVYEAVYFIRSLICALDKSAKDILDSGIVKVAYGVSRGAVNTLRGKKLPKRVVDCNLKDLLLVLHIRQRITAKKQEKKRRGAIGEMIDNAVKRTKNLVVDRANCIIDEHIASLLEVIAEELNLLYSDSFKYGISSLDSLALLPWEGDRR